MCIQLLMISSKYIATTLILSLVLPAFAHAYSFSYDLSLGDSGEDVRALQKVLNMSVETRVAESGPGAPGEETAYFGEKTRGAVIRYQELNKEEILSPLGLSAGTGYVGVSTRQSLTGESGALVGTSAGAETTSGVPAPVQTPSQQEAMAGFNEAMSLFTNRVLTPEEVDARNAQNRDLFVEIVRQTAETSGLSTEDISAIEESVIAQSEMPTTELIETFNEGRAQFETQEPRTVEQIRNDVAELSYNQNNIFVREIREFAYRATDALSPFPRKVNAQTGIPVGGAVYYAYLCTCSFTWLILTGMPRPGLLDYETGSQGFAGYNLPFSLYLKGWAMPVGPVCVSEPELDCALIIPSTYGLLLPITGSSPI